MGAKENNRRNRRRVFYRDGWQDDHGDWFAMCAYDCDTVISWHTASLDCWPVRPADGGRYSFDNVVLVCRPCRDKLRREEKAAEQMSIAAVEGQ